MSEGSAEIKFLPKSIEILTQESSQRAIQKAEQIPQKKEESLDNMLVRAKDIFSPDSFEHKVAGVIDKVLELSKEAKHKLTKNLCLKLVNKVDDFVIVVDEGISPPHVDHPLFLEFKHDIKNPLTCIKGFSEIAIDDFESGRIIESERENLEEGFQLYSETIDDICIDTLKTIMGEKSVGLSDPCGILTEVLAYSSTLIEGKNLSIQLSVNNVKQERIIKGSTDTIPQIISDRLSIKRAILNLLANSKKAIAQKERDIKKGRLSIEEYEPQIKVDISYNPEQKQVIITIEDNGIGIKDGDKDHVFEGELSGFARDEVEGTGMGLSKSRRDVQDAGGDLKLNWSRRNRGSRFQIILPTE